MSLKVAIIGAGPSGFYAAEALLRNLGEVSVDMIEKLPSPFGLVRAGVAPDHQSTKAVEKAFDRTARDERVRYYGNVSLGTDLSLDELRAVYDAVVLAVGAPEDRDLGIPGETLGGVVGSAAFVGWYNGHPEFRDLRPRLDTERAVVVGNGNVAIDVARVLVKTPREMAASDIVEEVKAAIADAPLREVVMLGRRGPAEAKFTVKELRELGELEDAVPLVKAEDLQDAVTDGLPDREARRARRNLEVLAGFRALPTANRRKRIRFEFYARPVELRGSDRVEAMVCERTRMVDGRLQGTGEMFEIACGLVVKAIGYRITPLAGVPVDTQRGYLRNRRGRIAAGLYCVGWCMRGPVGVIGTSKSDGDLVAAAIAAEVTPSERPGRRGLEALLRERSVRWVDYEEWQIIDRAERAAAQEPAPRRKFVSVQDMLALLDEPCDGMGEPQKPQGLRG